MKTMAIATIRTRKTATARSGSKQNRTDKQHKELEEQARANHEEDEEEEEDGETRKEEACEEDDEDSTPC